MLFEKILFPIDFSEASRAMVPEVQDMARRCNAAVTVLHSFNLVKGHDLAGSLDATAEHTPLPYTPEIAELREQEEERLQSFARERLADAKYAVIMEDGDPAAIIRKIVERDGMDLIMMPTRGMGTFRRLLLGSVTAKVLHDIDCAVFTSAHELDAGRPYHSGYRRIVCAVELNEEEEIILKTAGDFARMCGARLSIVHVRQPHLVIRSDHATERDVSATIRRVGMEAEVRVFDAEVADGIRRIAIDETADLVVVGRGKDRSRISCLWSDLYEIIRESPCPVLSV